MNSRQSQAPLPRLASLDNFRDVAGSGTGYPTKTGSFRRGILFRSNRVEASDADAAVLEGLGLTAIHDLRESHEIDNHPNRAVPGAVWHHHPVEGVPQKIVAALSSIEQTYEAMLGNYRSFVADPACRAGFSSLLNTISTTAGPQLFHCSAGQDRTGWAALVLHHIAGVETTTAVADYLLTNEYAHESRRIDKEIIVARFGATRAPAFAPAFHCETAYLDAGLDEARRRFGGMDGYLTEGLGLTYDTVAKIRAKITHSHPVVAGVSTDQGPIL